MKKLLLIILSFNLASCLFKGNPSKNPAVSKEVFVSEKALEQNHYRLLKEYAICQCLYAAPGNEAVAGQDVSPAVYANILNYVGVDTLASLATKEGLNLKPEKYSDYENKKAPFFRCSQWANSPAIDSLIRRYAAFSVAAEQWEYDSTSIK